MKNALAQGFILIGRHPILKPSPIPSQIANSIGSLLNMVQPRRQNANVTVRNATAPGSEIIDANIHS
jgi:hypothetical protein